MASQSLNRLFGNQVSQNLEKGRGGVLFFITFLSFLFRSQLVIRFPLESLLGRQVSPLVLFQIALMVGDVVAALMITLVQPESSGSPGSGGSLVGRKVGLFVRFQIARIVAPEVAALMITLVLSGSLIGRQVGLLVLFQIALPVGSEVAAPVVTLVHLGSHRSQVGRQVDPFVFS